MNPFIPSWLNQAGLSQAEFRVYCCLCSRADNVTRIAYPSAESIAKDCQMAKNTVWKAIKSLESNARLIERVGKKFGSSTRYKVLSAIGANDNPIENTTSANKIPIAETPIGANEILQSAQMDSHQSAQMDSHECNPKNVIQRRISKSEVVLPFDSELFRTSWREWQQHRIEKKKKLTPTSERLQLKRMASWGEERAIAAINLSIEKNWEGIFEPKQITTRPIIEKTNYQKNGQQLRPFD
jgi:DNA-binding MarR family transcriptional regulator